MKVAVTGGSGLAGYAVVAHLLDAGCDVISIDRAPSPSPLPEYRLVDCADLGQVVGACQGAEAIVHLAAIPRPIHHSPDQVFRTNVMATFNVFEAAAVLEIPRVVYISSMSVLGLPFSYTPIELDYLPIDEAHPKAPQDAYALSKTLGEDIALAFVRRQTAEHGLPQINLQPHEGLMVQLFVRMCAARKVVEVGALAGYSAIWIARALPGDGQLITIDKSGEHCALARAHIQRAGLAGR